MMSFIFSLLFLLEVGGQTATHDDLYEMPVVTSESGVLQAHLTVDQFLYDNSDIGVKYWTRLYNPGDHVDRNILYPGPILKFKRGDTVEVTLENKLEAEYMTLGPTDSINSFHYANKTNLHTHGLHVSAEDPQDNVLKSIEPHDSHIYTYYIPDDHAGGTFWYHAHHHGSTSIQVGGGLVGIIIIEDELTELPESIYGLPEVAIIMSHVPFPKLRDIGVNTVTGDDLATNVDNIIPGGPSGEFVFVNGQYQPSKVIESDKWQRVRLVYSSVDSSIRIAITENSAGCVWHLLAKDGIYVDEAPRPLGTIVYMGPGNRVDVVLKCANAGTMTFGSVSGGNNDFVQNEILKFDVVSSNASNPDGDLARFHPYRPNYLADVYNAPAADVVTKTVDFQGGGGTCTINGQVWDGNTATGTMETGSIQEWNVLGNGGHPFHLHVNSYQLKSVSGSSDGFYEEGDWHDVVMTHPGLNIGGYVFSVDTFVTKSVLHCHFLTHEDLGCMGYFQHTDSISGISTGLQGNSMSCTGTSTGSDSFPIDCAASDPNLPTLTPTNYPIYASSPSQQPSTSTFMYPEESMCNSTRINMSLEWIQNNRGTAGLVLSYISDESWTTNRGYTYGNSLAAISLLLHVISHTSSHLPVAEGILDALANALVTDATDSTAKYSLFYCDINTGNCDGSIRSGQNAWVAEGFALHWLITGNNRYEEALTGICNYLLIRIAASGDRGCITGGPDVSWCSVEHAIDSYFVLHLAAYLTGISAFRAGASTIAESLFGDHIWDSTLNRFNQGYDDPYFAMDVNSWGTIFLLNHDEAIPDGVDIPARIMGALSHLDDKYLSDQTCILNNELASGYGPYADSSNGYHSEVVWSEGTLGVALAYRRNQNISQAESAVAGLDPLWVSDGSYLYAAAETVVNVGGEKFYPFPSVAGTGWYGLACGKMSWLFWNADNDLYDSVYGTYLDPEGSHFPSAVPTGTYTPTKNTFNPSNTPSGPFVGLNVEVKTCDFSNAGANTNSGFTVDFPSTPSISSSSFNGAATPSNGDTWYTVLMRNDVLDSDIHDLHISASSADGFCISELKVNGIQWVGDVIWLDNPCSGLYSPYLCYTEYTYYPSSILNPSMQPSTSILDTIQPTATHVDTMQPTVTQLDTMQPTATHMDTMQPTVTQLDTIQPTVTQLDTMQPTVTQLDTMQPTAIQLDTIQPTVAELDAMEPTQWGGIYVQVKTCDFSNAGANTNSGFTVDFPSTPAISSSSFNGAATPSNGDTWYTVLMRNDVLDSDIHDLRISASSADGFCISELKVNGIQWVGDVIWLDNPCSGSYSPYLCYTEYTYYPSSILNPSLEPSSHSLMEPTQHSASLFLPQVVQFGNLTSIIARKKKNKWVGANGGICEDATVVGFKFLSIANVIQSPSAMTMNIVLHLSHRKGFINRHLAFIILTVLDFYGNANFNIEQNLFEESAILTHFVPAIDTTTDNVVENMKLGIQINFANEGISPLDMSHDVKIEVGVRKGPATGNYKSYDCVRLNNTGVIVAH